jgi:hypothetical protein
VADPKRAMYDHEVQSHRQSALSALTWIENRTAEIRRILESDSDTGSIPVSSARNMATDVAELATYLARIQTLDEWRFLVTDDTDNGGK